MASERLDVLKQLNSCNHKANIKVSEMALYELYNIHSAKLCSTKYGLRVILELKNHQIMLPSRFSTLRIEALREINRGGFKVANIGPTGKTFNIIFTLNDLEYSGYNEEDSYFQPSYYSPASDIDALTSAAASDLLRI